MILTFHFTADDPTEDTVRSRALTMMAVSSYAVKEKKKKERSERAGADYDEVVTESPQEDTREGMQESVKKNHGNKQWVTGRVLNLRKKELSSASQRSVRVVFISFIV